MGTTTKMAIPYPEATGLVKDGWEDMKDIATQVDAKSGLILLSTTDFSGVSSQSFSSVFVPATYNFWRVVIRNYGSVATNTRIKARVNTTDQSTGHYGASYYADYTGGAAVFSSANNAAQATICAHSTSSTSLTLITADISLDSTGNYFVWSGNAWSGDGAKAHFFSFGIGASGANGFTIIPTSGTITGTCTIFAYNK